MHPIPVNTMLTPPDPALQAQWNKILEDENLSMGRANHDVLADEAMLDFLCTAKLRSNRGRSRVTHSSHCNRCGKLLLSKRPNRKWCDDRCRQRNPPLPELICGNCNQPFQPLRSTARFHKECRQRAYRVRIANITT
jgi:hypothetical protein